MNLPIILAHGAVGPLDEILPPVLLGGILGMIALTWWNGRKATVTPPPPPTELPINPLESAAHPEPIDDSHFPVT